MDETVLVTGGYGFMGNRLVTKLSALYKKVVVVDCFTYAARPNLKFPENVSTETCDIRDHWALSKVFDKWQPKKVFHLAAESHVCRSIEGPRDFFQTNTIGTFHICEESNRIGAKLIHISTDEVFGEIKKGRFTEHSSYDPRSPYAASKASGDHIVRCYGETYGLDYIIVHPSNNFGPNQHEEKLISRTILRLLNNEPVVVHGRGDHMREWLFVDDFAEGVILLSKRGKSRNSYCLGGEYDCTNLEMIKLVHEVTTDLSLCGALRITHTDDRPTDDFRYAMSSVKAIDLGYKTYPKEIKQRLKSTVLWYYKNTRVATECGGGQG